MSEGGSFGMQQDKKGYKAEEGLRIDKKGLEGNQMEQTQAMKYRET